MCVSKLAIYDHLCKVFVKFRKTIGLLRLIKSHQRIFFDDFQGFYPNPPVLW